MKFCPLDLLVQKTNLLDLQVKNPLDLLVKEASRVVAVAELLEGLAEVEDLETPVVPRCQEVRHLTRQGKIVVTLETERESERKRERDTVIERQRDRETNEKTHKEHGRERE